MIPRIALLSGGPPVLQSKEPQPCEILVAAVSNLTGGHT